MSVLILVAKRTSVIIGKRMYYNQKTELRGQFHRTVNGKKKRKDFYLVTHAREYATDSRRREIKTDSQEQNPKTISNTR